MKDIFLNRKRIIKICLFFSLLIVLGYGVKIYGASELIYIRGVVNLKASDDNGKLVFKTDGLKLDSDYTSENTLALNNGDAKFELYLITNIAYKTQWKNALKYNSAKFMAQRTFTKSSSNNYEWKNDLSSTYTITDIAAMKKVLEYDSSPEITQVSSAPYKNEFSINVSQGFFKFKYYYFYTKEGSYTIGSNPIGINFNIMCSVNGGAWKKYEKKGVSTNAFNLSYDDFNAGDVVKIKLVDDLGMGYESNTIEVKIHSLTIDANGGTFFDASGKSASSAVNKFSTFTNVSKNILYDYGIAFNSENAYSTSFNIVSQPTRKGYTFKGWKITEPSSNGGSITLEKYHFNDSQNVYKYSYDYAGNVTISAQWEQNTYTLTVNPNGGSMNNGSTATTSSFTTNFVYGRKTYIGNIGSDNTYKTLNVPTREGYTFTGWSFSNGSGGVNTSGDKFYFSDTSTYASSTNTYIFNGNYKGNVTATAQWEQSTFTLTINPNGGTMYNGSTTTTDKYNIKFQYGAKRGLGYYTDSYYGYDSTFGKPYREGYTFDGWKVTSGGGTISYITGTASDRPYAYMNDEFKTMGRPGSWSYYLFNGDYKGNVIITAQWKDNTPPEWTTKDSNGIKVSGGLYITPSSWTNRNAVISASAQDKGSGMSSVKIYNSSNKELATGSSSAAYTQSEEGIIYYYAVATDKAGNTATTDKKAAYIDKTPPVITAGTTSSGWTNADIKLTATATDALSGLEKVEIYNASGNLLVSGRTGVTYTITEQTNEEYIIKATDVAGNTTEKKQSVQLDKENSGVIIDSGTDTPAEFKPGAAIESHVIGWINKDVPIKVTATDVLSGIKSIELKDHYGNVIKSDNKELQYTFTTEGISHYTIIVTDNAGNTKTINLTVKIDKTPPVIVGDEEVKDPNYGLIEHQAVDSLSGIKSFKLYYYDTMQEVTEDDGLVYKDDNTISFKSINTFNLYWKLIAEDMAGNITEVIVHTPYNFKIKVEADNLRTETENFLIGSDAQLKITLWGYVDTVEVKFERTLEDAAEKEEYTLDRLIESGDAFIRVPEKNDYVEYTFKLPEGVDPREYRIWVYGYRDGWKRTEHVDINLITYEQLCKEQVHKFKRVIKSPTWRKIDEYPIN